MGCLECRDTGYRGRAGVYEIMLLSDSLKELITADTDLVALRRQAYKEHPQPAPVRRAEGRRGYQYAGGSTAGDPQSEQK